MSILNNFRTITDEHKEQIKRAVIANDGRCLTSECGKCLFGLENSIHNLFSCGIPSIQMMVGEKITYIDFVKLISEEISKTSFKIDL